MKTGNSFQEKRLQVKSFTLAFKPTQGFNSESSGVLLVFCTSFWTLSQFLELLGSGRLIKAADRELTTINNITAPVKIGKNRHCLMAFVASKNMSACTLFNETKDQIS